MTGKGADEVGVFDLLVEISDERAPGEVGGGDFVQHPFFFLTAGRIDDRHHPFQPRRHENAPVEVSRPDIGADELVALTLNVGECGVKAMALLDKANTSAYGNPWITKVNIGAGTRPGILVSGHDLKDLEELLEQTAGTGVDVYTRNEMLPAHYHPAFKRHAHFVGNYGNAWWKQREEFASFNGPILSDYSGITTIGGA